MTGIKRNGVDQECCRCCGGGVDSALEQSQCGGGGSFCLGTCLTNVDCWVPIWYTSWFQQEVLRAKKSHNKRLLYFL